MPSLYYPSTLLFLVWPVLTLFSSLHSVHLTTFKYMNFYLCPGLRCHWFRFYTECSYWPLERTLLCLNTLLFALQETCLITEFGQFILNSFCGSMSSPMFSILCLSLDHMLELLSSMSLIVFNRTSSPPAFSRAFCNLSWRLCNCFKVSFISMAVSNGSFSFLY